MSLTVGIDFTGSNGNPTDLSSLHFFNPRIPDAINFYQKAILAIGQIVLNYDHDKMVPTYGFGAVVNYPNSPLRGSLSHFFPCSGDFGNSTGYGVDGVFELYSRCLRNVTLSGPTFFAPMIREIVEQTRKSYQLDPNSYNIMLILTDGAIHDMADTKDWIVEGSELPLSIIVIGIGNADFSLMEALDSDDKVVSLSSFF